jgi:hypothetical protein
MKLWAPHPRRVFVFAARVEWITLFFLYNFHFVSSSARGLHLPPEQSPGKTSVARDLDGQMPIPLAWQPELRGRGRATGPGRRRFRTRNPPLGHTSELPAKKESGQEAANNA